MAVKNYAYVNKEMLLWARGETPFATVEEATPYLSGITAEKLAAWEDGSDYPSINEAKKLATLYRVPLACFYNNDGDERTYASHPEGQVCGQVQGQDNAGYSSGQVADGNVAL